MKSVFILFFSLILGLSVSGCKAAETATATLGEYESPKEDFRGAWLTSVVNLDWPVSNEQAVGEQKADAIAMLDSLKNIGINAVLFQVRAESDALYASSYDPWSFWLTGEQGRAPDPFYDPLSFMIRESHKRGMELHAWLNPYRVERKKGEYDLAGSNVSRREPGWILEFESRPGEYYTMLNPGLPEVRDYVTNVVMDIVRRYDVDGIHFDDYFYPYSPVTDEDSLTYLEHHNNIEDIEDWRRHNVNRLMVQINDSLQNAAPHVSFGVSPFAIRKNEDAGTNGFEGYYQLYADGLAWLEDRSIDYINPQLYFEIGHERADYAPMLEYWTRVADENRRHMYAGLATYKILPPTDWTLDQAVDQLNLNIATNSDPQTGRVHGNIYFRTEHLLMNPKGYTDVVSDELHRYPALTPSMPWKSRLAPPKAEQFTASWSADGRMILTWKEGRTGEDEAKTARFAVYRIKESSEFYESLTALSGERKIEEAGAALRAENMVEVTGSPQFADRWPDDRQNAIYIVTAVSHNSIESTPVILKTNREDDHFTWHKL